MLSPALDTPLHINTPLLLSPHIVLAEANVWLKIDALQPAGSFKNRGIGVACQHYVRNGAQILVSSSGGNAGIAAAFAGSQLSVPVSIVVPENAPQTAIDAMRKFGAEVEVNGSTWGEAHEKALRVVESNKHKGAVLIHPFDDPLLWPGHATLIDEVIAAGCTPDAVVLSVGGGGLLTGVARGLAAHNLSDCEIVAVETCGAASLAAAIKAGMPVMLDEINTIANTLGAKQVSDAAYQATQSHPVTSQVVSDRQALDACTRFLQEHRVLVEPACGAALAAVYEPAPVLKDKQNILVVVCGGMGVSLPQLSAWEAQLSVEKEA
ncbi:MAG: pyridoxal-phosphate dependent enzyme [Granulosicoccus sp.]|nr:pyridoxal-phosphate dependent enzyme [Granulosicoccus sp.]